MASDSTTSWPENKDFEIAGAVIAPGERRTIQIPISMLSIHVPVSLPVHVINGPYQGPVLFLSAAIHGDEILGVEIIRRLLRLKMIRLLRGTLLAVPIVNAFGFLGNSRYLPDRRDLNRSFPGGPDGSLAAQIAHIFMTEIVRRATCGIDLHTASNHRVNLPQIRGDMDRPGVKALAEAFGAPVMLHSNFRDGSLRTEANEIGVPVVVYEAGEALRFDEFAIRAGVRGCLRVMQHLGMFGPARENREALPSVECRTSVWVRAPIGGIFRTRKTIGDSIVKGESIGAIADPFGENDVEVLATTDGIIIGQTNLPVVNQGDALFHIAQVFDAARAGDAIDEHEAALEHDPLFDSAAFMM